MVQNESCFLRKLGCKSALAEQSRQTESDEEGNWKGNSPVVSIPPLLIQLDRGPCCKTTNDLYMQPWHGDHYVTTSQITVAITTVKQEAVSRSLLPPAESLIVDEAVTPRNLYDLKASLLIFSHYRSYSLYVSTIKMERCSHAENKGCACEL